MQSIAKGSFVDGVGSIIAGLLGGTGINVSSSSMALTLMTKIASRKIAYYFAAILCLFAFCQKLSVILVYLPVPLIAAALVFLGTSLIYTGFKTVMPYISVPKNAIILGVSFMLGFSYGVYPDFYAHLPPAVEYFTGSALAISAVCAILLNFIFSLSLGASNHMSFEFTNTKSSLQHRHDFMTYVSHDWNISVEDMQPITIILNLLAESYAKLIDHTETFLVNISQNKQDIYVIIRCKQPFPEQNIQDLEVQIGQLSDYFSIKNKHDKGLYLKAKFFLITSLITGIVSSSPPVATNLVWLVSVVPVIKRS